ncbi:MAG: class I SAM-dependent methyltransferase [Variovorax sp.]|nr:class I SAM-dependent methyltransferase [Variovorax sp.]
MTPSNSSPSAPAPRDQRLAHPLQRWLLRLTRGLRVGTLRIALPNGQRIDVQGTGPGPHAVLILHRWRAVLRMITNGDIGLARSYRDGDWSSPDLLSVMALALENEAHLGAGAGGSRAMQCVDRIRHRLRANTRKGSRDNIAFHYDLGNDFYKLWLDAELNYSSGIYGSGSESLEEAQAAKMARILDLLKPDEGSDVLEIGCGWGALALAIAQRHRARVTGLTLSTQQLAHARQRVAGEGLQASVDLRLQDYRDVGGTYDRIVSIEMLEAVGQAFWPGYFRVLRERLRPGGHAVLQVITIADEHFDLYSRRADFIQRFIFPGGMLPSWSALQSQALGAGLAIERAAAFGQSYAATLAHWRARFLQAREAVESAGFDASFRRLWEYYLCYCEAGFRAGRVDVGLYVVRHAAKEAR